jgi:HlyD family secretion protein
MTAEANIVVDQRENTLIVPNIYLRLDRRADQAFVNILRDGKVEEIEVKLGLQGQDVSEVVGGLQAGDLIVIDPNGEGFSLFGN